MSLNTGRAVSIGAESQLGVVHRVLDRGEVELVDYMGTDEQLCRVARVSTGSERQDTGILGYLVRHAHSSPIEFGQIVLRVKLPIFVDRQWRRHRAASLTEREILDGATSPTQEDAYGTHSERSLRYQPPLTAAYVPPPEYVQGKGAGIKQGRGSDLATDEVESVRGVVTRTNADALLAYSEMSAGVGGRFGPIAPELARSVLPLGTYTEWYWRIDAWNLMHWLQLRLHPHAQAEIRAYADVVMRIFEAWVPVLAAAFRTHRLNSLTLSQAEVDAFLRMATDERLSVSDVGDGMSAGERAEFAAKVARLTGSTPTA